MAYLGGIATKLTGSVGQFTFKQRGGLTVVSERVTNVANPRTAALQNQRTKWGNVVRLYSGIAPLPNCSTPLLSVINSRGFHSFHSSQFFFGS